MESNMEGGRRKRLDDQQHHLKSSENNNTAEETATVDWRGRPSNPTKHGLMTAAAFVLGLQAFEIMAIAAVANNLITYLINEMHYSLPESANIVTNFVGTVFIIALLGGYLSDSYLGCFWTMLIFGFVELSGFILLSVQAHIPQLKPPKCNMGIEGHKCDKAKGFKSLIFFMALYLVALGSGCVKPNMIAHGADQFNKGNPQESKKMSKYFNGAYFAFSIGELIALTILVWVQTHSGMDIGFAISAAAMAMGLISLVFGILLYRNKPPQGTILLPIAQVIVAAILKRKENTTSCDDPRVIHGDGGSHSHSHPKFSNSNVSISQSNRGRIIHPLHTQRFRFLDKACIKTQDTIESPWRLCTIEQVEQVKTLISVIPIFACTIIFNTILAQLQTFSVQQASSMNTQLTNSFKIPPASLQAIPYIMLIFIVPLYDTFFVPFARNITGHDSGISPLTRIGFGLFLSTFSMVAAALMENKRRINAVEDGKIISIFWITPQFLIFGLSEMFTAVGLIEFFYKQSLKGMQSFLTAITYTSYSFGFFFSSVLVSLVNKITSYYSSGAATSRGGGWLSDVNLNKDRLDLFYWLLACLSLFNFFNYIFWARWHYRNAGTRLLHHDQSAASHISSFSSRKIAGDETMP